MAADAWALGCVLHFCVEARPKFSSKDEETSRALILAFDGSAGNFRRQHGFGHSAIMNLGFVLFRYQRSSSERERSSP